MGNLIFWSVMGLFLLGLFIKENVDAKRTEKKWKEKLIADFGKKPVREYKAERLLRLTGYYNHHRSEGQLDDITWNDLNLDEVFKRMNDSLSSVGEEYLYYTLRTPKTEKEELDHREKLIAYFSSHEKERVEIQLLYRKLGGTGNYSLYDYLDYIDDLKEQSVWLQMLLNILILCMIPVCLVNFSVGFAAMMILMVFHIFTYLRKKREIAPYITGFSFLMRLLDFSESLIKLPVPVCEKEWERIRTNLKKASAMRTGYQWIASGASNATGGNPLEILKDYVNMIFHIDIILFYRLLHVTKDCGKEIEELVTCAGFVETMICISGYRASLGEKWCIPQFHESQNEETLALGLEEGYHPLIEGAVPNTILTDRCILLTGSNASGKSTFLKMVALNAIFAQTIHTCLAKSYRGAFYRIYSSMALKDNVCSGESYFIVEIKSLKRILDAAEARLPVLCFVDEVLRGTNTVERVAASTQILKSLSRKNVLCFAATHDIELTDSLEDCYANYHFEEEIKNGDIQFAYKLLQGKATSRNAIKLLELMGYDKQIISAATEHVQHIILSKKGHFKDSILDAGGTD